MRSGCAGFAREERAAMASTALDANAEKARIEAWREIKIVQIKAYSAVVVALLHEITRLFIEVCLLYLVFVGVKTIAGNHN
jgi:hypothetical protein